MHHAQLVRHYRIIKILWPQIWSIKQCLHSNLDLNTDVRFLRAEEETRRLVSYLITPLQHIFLTLLHLVVDVQKLDDAVLSDMVGIPLGFLPVKRRAHWQQTHLRERQLLTRGASFRPVRGALAGKSLWRVAQSSHQVFAKQKDQQRDATCCQRVPRRSATV